MIKRLDEGWSSDLKFYIEDLDGNKLLLRISEAAVYDNKREEFQFIKKCNTLPFPMSQAIDFGFCNNNQNVYMLLTWVEGKALEKVLQDLTEEEQYRLGLQAGINLKSIHSLEVESGEIAVTKDK